MKADIEKLMRDAQAARVNVTEAIRLERTAKKRHTRSQESLQAMRNISNRANRALFVALGLSGEDEF